MLRGRKMYERRGVLRGRLRGKGHVEGRKVMREG